MDLGADTPGPNIRAGLKATGLYPCDVNVPLNKLPDFLTPIRLLACRSHIRESVVESFKRYIDDLLRNNDLGVKQTQKFQIPIVAGKSVSVEEIQKHIVQREQSKNKPKTSTKKRGWPIGSKNSQAKRRKKQATKRMIHNSQAILSEKMTFWPWNGVTNFSKFDLIVCRIKYNFIYFNAFFIY